MQQLKQSTENYLKIIFKLQQIEKGGVKPLHLARTLDVSPPAVTDMLKKLSEERFVDYTPYHGVKLTKKGMIHGQNMVRRHRLWEMYLHKMLGFPWDKVHEEAERLEHASSDDVINKIEEVLGFPEYDPHGDPIPSKEGVFPKAISSVPLSKCKVGEALKVIRVSDFDNDFLHYIDTLGIQLQKFVVIKEIRSFDHSLLISIDGRVESISALTASHIFVVKKGQKT